MHPESGSTADSPEQKPTGCPDVPFKKGLFMFQGEEPVKIIDTDDDPSAELSPERYATCSRLGAVVKAYRRSVKELLTGKYKHLVEHVPNYLRTPGNALVICCEDGLVIRYEKKSEDSNVYAGWFSSSLAEATLVLSQQLIRCHPDDDGANNDSASGIELKIIASNPQTNKRVILSTIQIAYTAIIRKPPGFPQPPQKPFCLLSVRSAITIGTEIELGGEETGSGTGQHMLSLTRLSLPVGWDCIEVYPYLDLDHWKAEYTPMWAENDILAAVVTKQHQEANLRSLDPNAESRKQYATLLSEFKELLDSEPDREETLQQFIKRHPVLICPAYGKVWPKLKLGAHETDFVFRDATSDYLLVELERSTLRLFKKDGHPTQDLNHAKGQIGDWLRYIEDNLTALHSEQGLTGLSSNPRSLVVIGRSHDLTKINRRKLATLENQHPKLRIMTYDDVYDNFKNVITNLLGPLIDTGSTTEIYHLQKK